MNREKFEEDAYSSPEKESNNSFNFDSKSYWIGVATGVISLALALLVLFT